MTATIVMLFAQLLATNAHTSGISPATAGDGISSYGINIIGVPVTSENCNDLSVIDGVSGTVKYDPTTKTLTLENATIDTGDNTGDNAQGIFNSEVPDLNIQVNGTNKITSHSSAVTISQTTTISGTGTLNATSTDNCGIYVFNSALTIEDCTVSAIGKWGIAGPGYNNRAEFVIRNAIVTAKGSDGSICDISKFTLNNVAITSPTGAAYDSSLQGVALNGKVVTDIVAILPLTYGIKIAGAQVTHENYNNLSVINGVSGTVIATKPLVYQGGLIEDMRLRFAQGRVVEAHAKHGEEKLRQLLATDEGACHLGEVALVPYDSPISKSGLLFYNTLFDENAACHLAFGKAYPTCLKDGASLESVELLRRGVNDSLLHEDFMVGSRDLSIVGRRRADGREVPVFIDGNFAPFLS